MDGLKRLIFFAQGAYYVVMGAWPIFDINSFEAVTGPKNDDWLVQTVGLLAVAIGVSLVVGAWRMIPGRETVTLSILGAAAFGVADVVFVVRRIIGPIYLIDAVIEALFLVFLAAASRPLRRGPRSAPS